LVSEDEEDVLVGNQGPVVVGADEELGLDHPRFE
jgi:hypothetical protein